MLEFENPMEVFDHPEIISEMKVMFKGQVYNFIKHIPACERGDPAEVLKAQIFRCKPENHELAVYFNNHELRYVETRYCSF